MTLTLPAPHGRYATGESVFRLVDTSRPDPWVPSQPYRELMISVFYPAVHTSGHQYTYQMPAAEAAAVGADVEQNEAAPLPAGLVNWAATRTHSVQDAAMAPGRFPVVLYSPGAGDPRDWNVSLVENLAAQGFIVVTIDHTGEAPATEFPDGHIVGDGPLLAAFNQATPATVPAFLKKVSDVRTADTEFVLNRLPSLPGRLTKGMDLNRIGMFGHSAGGQTAADVMYTDPRIKAGVDLDGTLEYTEDPDGTHLTEVAQHGLKQPFLLMGSSGRYASDIHIEPSWASFWQHQSGWKADITLNDSQHQSFTDAEPLLWELAGKVPAGTLAADDGTVDPRRAVAADRALVDSFFDRFLKGCDDHLLDGRGASQYPITFVK